MKTMLQALVQLIIQTRGDRKCFVIVLVPGDAFCTADDIRCALPAPNPIIEREPNDLSRFPVDKFPATDLFTVPDYDHHDIDSTVPVLFVNPNSSHEGNTAAGNIANFADNFKPVQIISVTADGFKLDNNWWPAD